MAAPDRKAIIVGISGCSSSGKTTLARLLRDIFPNTFILHEDDFYKNDKDIPISVDGLADWDCAEALSLPDMEQALAHIRTHGVLPVSRNPHLTCRTDHGSRRRQAVSPDPSLTHHSPLSDLSTRAYLLTSTPSTPQPDLFSKEDQNSVGKCPVSDETIDAMKAKVQAWLQPGQPGHKLVASGSDSSGANTLRICIFDGFLLYSEETRATMEQIDVRLFLRVSHAKATQRREARDGYVTLEGFWQDPPGYVDKIVWPNYVKTHKWLFNDGDVEGSPNRATLEDNRILTQLNRGIDIDMATTLEWAVDTLMHELEGKFL
ncbi:ribosylnicotinamide kinase [Sporothrix bragantina]|uniref:Ribosylnicotinamide kinase n=1 Tax=Sporothrix bragantina TaxID=671064 RepID=A0ABP0CP54_9PEZI